MQRGIKSVESRAPLPHIVPVVSLRRPDPPKELTADEKIEWKAYVNRMPADWFSRETHPVLCDLCRAVVLSRYFADRLREVTADMEGLETRIREENPSIERKDFETAIEIRLDRIDKAARLQLEQSKQVGSLSHQIEADPAVPLPAQHRWPEDPRRAEAPTVGA